MAGQVTSFLRPKGLVYAAQSSQDWDSQREGKEVIIELHTEKVAPLHGLAYLCRYQLEPRVWPKRFALS